MNRLWLIALLACACKAKDDSFAQMQERGQMVMGVDQYAAAHVFEDLPDGGRIVLERSEPVDTADVTKIRAHMRDIENAFRAGDFTKPFHRGGEVRITTGDSAAVRAIHEFLAFQRGAHHAASHEN